MTDRISINILKHTEINQAINNNKNYICSETLANDLELVDELLSNSIVSMYEDKGVMTEISITKLN